MEPEETSIARQRLGKHVPAATNRQATIELLLRSRVFYAVHVEMLQVRELVNYSVLYVVQYCSVLP
jgi:hypothetical protein